MIQYESLKKINYLINYLIKYGIIYNLNFYKLSSLYYRMLLKWIKLLIIEWDYKIRVIYKYMIYKVIRVMIIFMRLITINKNILILLVYKLMHRIKKEKKENLELH